MTASLQISRIFGFIVVLSKTRVFMVSYLAWSILSIFLLLPFDACLDFNYSLYIFVEGFFSFAFNEWRDDLVLLSLF